MSPAVVAANGLWYLSCLRGRAAFERAARDVRRAQHQALRRIVGANARSAFGRAHGFESIREVAEFRGRVPIAAAGDVEPYVERIASGERGVLTEAPVLLLEPTSGSTRATRLVPYTGELRREFGRAVDAWIAALYGAHPRLFSGQSYWSISPVVRRGERSAGGLPVGFEEDAEYLGSLQRRLAARLMAVPAEVRLVAEIETFRYVTLLFLLRSESLALVSVWSPSFLLILLERARAWAALLCDDLARGGIDASLALEPAVRARLERALGARPARAAAVRAALAEPDAASAFARVWPGLEVVSCWADANAAGDARRLAALLPQARLQPKGLVATEGIVSFPLPGRPGAALAVTSHFLEFLPEGSQEAAPALGAWELEEGRFYSVVITTGGGLYRYRLRDRVEVVGRYRDCPLVRFAGKEDLVSDWFGEKLDELHVRDAIRSAFAADAPEFAMLSCEPHAASRAYTLFVEHAALGDGELAAAARRVEERLRENVHYAYARDLGQLEPVRAVRVVGGREAFVDACRRNGQREGDVKPLALHPRDGWLEVFHQT